MERSNLLHVSRPFPAASCVRSLFLLLALLCGWPPARLSRESAAQVQSRNALHAGHPVVWMCPRAADVQPAKAKPLWVEKPSPVAAAKAVKNGAELAGMREAHLRDAVALAETLLHLEQQVGFTLKGYSLIAPGHHAAWYA